jgi:hypothetical protein
MAKIVPWNEVLVDPFDGEKIQQVKTSRVTGRALTGEDGKPILEDMTLGLAARIALVNAPADMAAEKKNRRAELAEQIRISPETPLMDGDIDDIDAAIGKHPWGGSVTLPAHRLLMKAKADYDVVKPEDVAKGNGKDHPADVAGDRVGA